MWYWLYNIVLHAAFPIILGLLLVKKRLQRGLFPRLGFLPPELDNLSGRVVWVHAASLGEVMAVTPLLREIKQVWPEATLVVSTVTETGKEAVSGQLSAIALHCYAPLDFPWAVRRYLRALNPVLYILMESELWPNLLRQLHEHRVPVCLVNGRISSRSHSRYHLVRGFMGKVLRNLSLALMQTDRDADRITELGAAPDIVHVTGNMKFDQGASSAQVPDGQPISGRHLGLIHGELLWVAGSTHAQEEEWLLEAYQQILRSCPLLVLLLAPRHIERAGQLEQVVKGFGFSCIRRSQMSFSTQEENDRIPGKRVIILDTRGELASVYALGVAGFVGGTLVPVGGHNLLEPAHWGKPVLFGPFIDHCRDMARLLIDCGGGIQVTSVRELVEQMNRLLADPEKSILIGRFGFNAIQRNRGVVQKNLRFIRSQWNHVCPSSANQRGSDTTLSAPARQV